jgi:aerobic carbon-monoxide dehydrogenase medium subunit
MKPARFAYERPRDVAGALALLSESGDVARLMAGGQSLGPMLNLRLIEPALVIDIAGIPQLREAALEGADLLLGACITHADIEDGRVPDVTGGAMARIAGAIGYRAVRNRGTIGGSLSHADPAGDWVSALATLGASVLLQSRAGLRTMPVTDFILGALQSALGAGELLIAVRIPRVAASTRFGFAKSCRKAGDFADAIGAVLIDQEARAARVVIGAIEAPPMLLADAAPLFGGRLDGDFAARFDVEAAGRLLAEAGIADPVERHIRVGVLRKAVAEAGRC